MSGTGLGIFASSRNGSDFLGRSGNRSRAAQLSLYLVDGVHNRVGGDGSAGNLVDISQSERGNLADELSLESFFQSARAVAGGLVEESVANGDLSDSAGVVQRQGNGHGTGKTLHAGGIGRSAFAAHIHHKLTGGVNAAVDSSRGDGRAGNSVNNAVLQAGGALGKGQRHAFADELIGEAGFLGLGAQTGSFAEIVAADRDAGNHILSIQTNGYNDFAGIAANGGFYNIANAFAVGVKAFVAAVHRTAFFQLYLLKGCGGSQKTGTGLLRGTKRVFGNRTFGDQVENSQQQGGYQTNANQRHQIAKELLHNGESSFVFAS